MREKIKYVLCAFLTVMVLNMDMQPVTDELLESMSYYVIPIIFGYSGFNLFSLLEWILFYFFYRRSFASYHTQMQTLRGRLCCFLPAVLFGFFMVLGSSFDWTNSWGFIIGCDNPVQLFKSLFAWFCYSVLFVHLIALLFTFIDRYQAGEITLCAKKQAEPGRNAETAPAADVVFSETVSMEATLAAQTEEVQAAKDGKHTKKKPKDYDVTVPFRRFGRWYMRMLAAHPFRTAFLTLLAVYLPVAIVCYPAIINPDTVDEISQVFGIKYYSANALQLVDETVVWTNHHPVLYTLYLMLGMTVGHALFHSYNVGLFLCSIGQVLLFCAVVSMVIRLMCTYCVPIKILLVVLLYFVIHPQIVVHMCFLTKDAPYASFLLFMVLCLTQMLMGNTKLRTYVCMLIASCFVLLLRHEGIYVLALTFFVLFITVKKVRKRLAGALFLVIGVYLLWNQAILPAFHVTPGSVREMLSIPFQQTARYIVEYGDEVTEEEKEAINGVLEYDELAEVYAPTLSDNVKNLYKEDASTEELFAYFRVWLQMFWKHPGVYVEATLNNIYQYLWPQAIGYRELNARSNRDFWHLNQYLENNGIDAEFGRSSITVTASLMLDQWTTTLNAIPGTELLQSSALCVWLFLLFVFYACKTKKWRWIGCVLPVGFAICVCFASPVGGFYFRYILPTACTLPPIAALLVFGRPEKQPEGGLHGLPDTDSLHELPEGDAVLEAAADKLPDADSLVSCQNG